MLGSANSLITTGMPLADGMDPLNPHLEPTIHISSNPNLYVSAENALFKNYFAGPQVIEVIVSDPDINRLDQAYGEPDVTINGKKLRMFQNTDGNWYAYFAEVHQAMYADATQTNSSGKGLDFGQFCSASSAINSVGVDFSETEGIAVARHVSGASNGTNGHTFVGGICTGTSSGTLLNHVVRENKTLTHANGAVKYGQLGIKDGNLWPIIQLYDFSSFPATVVIQYNRAGGSQIVTLTFDRIPSNLIHAVAIRPYWPRGAQVQGDLLDPQLNIDPTDQDSWTWGASSKNNTLFYQAFDRNGNPDADGTPAMQNLIGNLTIFMFNHNGKLTETPQPQGVRVFSSQSNGIQKLTPDNTLAPPNKGLLRTMSISALSAPITLLEVQPNAGIFGDYDDGGIADLVILNNAPRDKSFIETYNEVSYSIVVKFSDAKLTLGPVPNQTSQKMTR